MENTKSPVASLTIWGAFIAAIPAIFALLGFDLSPEDAAGIQGNADAIVTSAGSLIAIYGRVKARTRLTRS